MFTGIIREVGEVTDLNKKNGLLSVAVRAPKTIAEKQIGESIAVNGVCVTITSIKNDSFSFDLMEESIDKSNLGDLKEKDPVNLEPALKMNQSLDGHIVQGHIDTTAKVKEIEESDSQTKIFFELPKEIEKYIAFKGSITVNGVSLTVCELREEDFAVALIPHTLKNTNLGKLKKGDKVNLEVDIMARYMERLIKNDSANQ